MNRTAVHLKGRFNVEWSSVFILSGILDRLRGYHSRDFIGYVVPKLAG